MTVAAAQPTLVRPSQGWATAIMVRYEDAYRLQRRR